MQNKFKSKFRWAAISLSQHTCLAAIGISRGRGIDSQWDYQKHPGWLGSYGTINIYLASSMSKDLEKNKFIVGYVHHDGFTINWTLHGKW